MRRKENGAVFKFGNIFYRPNVEDVIVTFLKNNVPLDPNEASSVIHTPSFNRGGSRLKGLEFDSNNYADEIQITIGDEVLSAKVNEDRSVVFKRKNDTNEYRFLANDRRYIFNKSYVLDRLRRPFRVRIYNARSWSPINLSFGQNKPQ